MLWLDFGMLRPTAADQLHPSLQVQFDDGDQMRLESEAVVHAAKSFAESVNAFTAFSVTQSMI